MALLPLWYALWDERDVSLEIEDMASVQCVTHKDMGSRTSE